MIGAGGVAQMYHLPALAAMEDVRIVWICDADEDRARAVAGRYGVTESCSDPEKAGDVDAVLLAIPVGLREKSLAVAFARRWHVLCEKPFATTRAEHERILADARQAGVRLGVVLMRRFYDGNERLRRIMAGRPFGLPKRILASEGNRLRGTGRGAGWYQTDVRAAGGGALIETGVHLIDQVFSGCGVTGFRLEAAGAQFDGLIENEVRARASVTLADDASCAFELGISRRHDLANAIVVEFDSLQIGVGIAADSAVTLYDHAGVPLGRLDPPGDVPLSAMILRAFGMEWRAFLDQCRAGVTTLADPASSLLTTDFIEQVYRHIRADRPAEERPS